jgi:hypothetical protein
LCRHGGELLRLHDASSSLSARPERRRHHT